MVNLSDESAFTDPSAKIGLDQSLGPLPDSSWDSWSSSGLLWLLPGHFVSENVNCEVKLLNLVAKLVKFYQDLVIELNELYVK